MTAPAPHAADTATSTAATPPALGPQELRQIGRALYQWCETDRMLGVGFIPPQWPSPFRLTRPPARGEEDAHDGGTAALGDAPTVEAASAPGTAVPTPATAGKASMPASAAPPAPLEEVVMPRRSAPAPTPAPARTPAPAPAPAVSPQSKIDRLAELRARHDRACPHCTAVIGTYTQTVFGEGDADARLMFIGEAPGEDEDRTGRPFVGRAGQLLDKMIHAMGLKREEVFIANVLKARPPGNATPTAAEVEKCSPYLAEQIAIIRPEVIVALGLPASRFLLQSTEPMGRMRGRFHTWRHPQEADLTIDVMPTYHPAYVLRNYNADTRAKVWSDLQQVMDRLGLKAEQR